MAIIYRFLNWLWGIFFKRETMALIDAVGSLDAENGFLLLGAVTDPSSGGAVFYCPTSYTLASIELYLQKVVSPDGNVTVSIYATAMSGSERLPTGSALATASIAASGLGAEFTSETFEFTGGNAITLTRGYYAFNISSNSNVVNGTVLIGSSSLSRPEGARSFYYTSGAFAAWTTIPYFTVRGTTLIRSPFPTGFNHVD